MWAWQFMKMLGLQRARGLAPFVSMQNYVNLVYREEEREMLPLCRAEGIAVTPWSPLARGFLAGSKPRGGAATVRARTDTYQDALGLGAEQDHAILRAGRGGGGSGSASSRRRWRWPGCSACPASPRRSSAPPSRTTSPTRWPRSSLTLDAETRAYLEEPYRPRPVSGHA